MADKANTTRRTFMKGGITLAATVSAVGVSANVFQSILDQYRRTNAAWLATEDENGEVVASGPEYEAAWECCKNVIRHQCQTDEEVQQKLYAIVVDEWLSEAAATGWDAHTGYLYDDFIKSMII